MGFEFVEQGDVDHALIRYTRIDTDTPISQDLSVDDGIPIHGKVILPSPEDDGDKEAVEIVDNGKISTPIPEGEDHGDKEAAEKVDLPTF